MKIVLTAALIGLASAAGARPRNMAAVVDEYRDCDGVTVLSIGSFGTAALRAVVRLCSVFEDVPELRDFLNAARGVRRITIVDFEDCDSRTRNRLVADVGKVLDRQEMIMEVKDEGEKFGMYASVSDDGARASDFTLFSREGTLICFFGDISTDALAKIEAD